MLQIKSNYDTALPWTFIKSLANIYPIIPPPVKTGCIYYFKIPGGAFYEVKFIEKSQDYKEFQVKFSVINEDPGEERTISRHGEIYGIFVTVLEIFLRFHEQHPNTQSYEFSGAFKEDEDEELLKIRGHIYSRYIKRLIVSSWEQKFSGDKVIFRKKAAIHSKDPDWI